MNTTAPTAAQPMPQPQMRELRLRLKFLTPAFLGDAEQNGRWRTPPFKAQLRQSWRIAYAADRGFAVDLEAMRREEGLLFGNAWLENEFRKSLVRLRLQPWAYGSLKAGQWPADVSVTHPEVKNRDGRNVPVGSALYLGYGPLIYDNQRRATALKANAAIQAGEAAELALAFPTSDRVESLSRLARENASRIERALWLMDRYGTVGGRSRNGWGSYVLEADPRLKGAVPLRDWRQCLDLDWPHAIGRDEKGPLIWQTAPHADWKALMKTLAIIKIGLRTQFVFGTGRGAATPEGRHWLSYPVTNHDVRAWGPLRLPNQLRFKVRQAADGQLVGVIFHMPHLPPRAFGPDRSVIESVWRQVHRFLDAPEQKLSRIEE
ncbi:MAG TPA: RAMP superfamily CRISPR-associated protein [Burkholderiaceae bacterium]|jgi:CRISPR-associated protein Cmr1|nr:RAMP superfamily CRISPR-associated protein [Burkholderiaceae bacterium]